MSTTTAPSSVNGAPAGNSANSSFSSSAGGGKAQLKMTATDASRKQAGSPIDQAQRKPAPQAWKGTNPITQRPSNPTSANGVAPPAKQPAPTKNAPATSKESNTADRHANDRLMFLLANFIGLSSTVTVRNGDQYNGIFSGWSQDTSRYVLKMVKRLEARGEQQSNGVSESIDEYIGQGNDHVMTFDCQDVVDLNVANVSTDQSRVRGQNGVSSGFRTDADISANHTARERELQRWEPSADGSVDLSLDSSGVPWDQFEANERQFGLKSSYDEEIYTTKIDKSHPQYAQRAAKAERLAREIEGGAVANAHVAEERGLKAIDDSGLDEEDKYSGVRRDFEALRTGNPNKYTPPARRPPTGQPTVPGAPYDPAILQASIAKPAASPSLPSEPVDTTKAEVAPEKTDKTGQVTPAKPTETSAPAPVNALATELKTVPLRNDRKPSDSGKKAGPENASETVERDLMDAFKDFAKSEKARVHNQQRQRANQDKQMKINDLKKFAQNFKLNTPVPTDLVPILAKDEVKQKEIVEKAKQAAEEIKMTPPKPAPATGAVSEQKAPRPAVANQQTPMSPADRNQQRRQGPGQYQGSFRGDPRTQGQGMAPRQPLGPRLSYNQQQLRAGMPPQHIPGPAPIQIPQQGPPGVNNGIQSPGSAINRLNVSAREFKPNPAANTFSPTMNQSNTSSPRHESARPVSKGLSDFFEGRTPLSADQRPSLEGMFNPINRMMKEVAADEKQVKDFFVNGGIPNAFKTHPAWEVPETNQDLTYAQALEKASMAIPPIASPPHTILQSGPIPHQHQLPLHLQQTGPVMQSGQTPHQTPRHMPVQPHHGQAGPHHFDEHRMQYSQSQSSVHPSPRAVPQFMAMSGPNGQPVPVYQQPMGAYGVSPSGHPVALRQLPPGAQFVSPQHAMMGGHMMSQQASSGPYVQVQPNMPMYQQSPAPGHAFPHQHAGGPGGPMQGPGAMQGGAPNGYPSPRPAPMMQHQGSQQGHAMPQGPGGQQMMYVGPNMHGQAMYAAPSGPMTPMRQPFPQPHQPHYGASPHQHQHFPQHQNHAGPMRGTPSMQYAQPMMPQHSMGGHPQQQQGGPPPPPPQQQQGMDGGQGEDGK